MKIRLTLLGVLLLPAAGFAQPSPDDPDTPAQAPQAGRPAPAPMLLGSPGPAAAPTSQTTTEPAYQEITEPYNARLLTTGALVFAASYGTSVIVAASSSNDRGNDRLYVPLLGPWLALHDRSSCDVIRASCDHETTAKVLLVADGVFQAAGIIGMVGGALQPSSHRVVTRTAKLDTKLHLRPTMVHGDPGISVFAHF